MSTTSQRLLWGALLGVALLWPAHALSTFDGLPLDGRAEAVLVGVAVPVLLWLRGKFLDGRFARVAIAALLVIKAADAMLLTPQGLCAKFSTAAPYAVNVLTIPIEEPAGALRSWDARADWRSAAPVCTAIVDRPYLDPSSFPAWFTNLTTFDAVHRAPVAMDVSGFARVDERGVFVVETGRGMAASGHIGGQNVSSTGGRPVLAALDAGTHRLDLHIAMGGDDWLLVPTFNGRGAFSATTLTVAEPRAIDRLAGVFGVVEVALVVLIAVVWIGLIAVEYRDNAAMIGWAIVSAVVLGAAGFTGRFERLAVLLLAGAVLVPVSARHRQLRGAMLLVGVPWFVLIAVRSLPQVAHFTTYSNDDWLAYQAAGYRIFMHGFWLEGGSRVFDYQPLYRWISGALHLVFGDSSVGETFWDAVCLWLGAAVAFVLVNRAAGFRWGLAAGAATLATFWIGTIWYFPGRGLSEVSAAGFGFASALLLARDEGLRPATAGLAGVFAVLMFYTRLNHLIFAVFLLALATRLDARAAGAYLATFAAGVAAFALRTWWYTGVFSILYGTSLKNNDTGLRLATLTDATVWSKVWHSLRALVWMNEPPSFDPRAILVVAGVLLAVLAVVSAPKINRPVLSIAVVTLGACVSSLFAHTHNYPGRMSIHLVPFAVAMTAIAGARLFAR